MKIGIILVNYKDYAQRFLADCLQSICSLDSAIPVDLFIVDNASSLETEQYLKTQAPEARLILNKHNDGFAKGNNDALRVMIEEAYDYAVLLNMDAQLTPQAITEMLKVAESNQEIAAVQARLMLAQDHGKINSLGNMTHFLGFGYCQAYGDADRLNYQTSADIAYPSGACVMLKIKALESVGLFDEKLWMYNEDQDLGWRFWLQGWRCAIALQAVAYHHYEFSRSISKYYWLERNRLIVAWKNYATLSLILFFPALVIMEIALLIFSLRSGWFLKKVQAILYFFNPLNWPYLIKARREVQKKRQRRDYEILHLFSGAIAYQEIDNFLLKRIANPVFTLYFQLMRRVISWFKQ
jgi:GT2 family glycosyltransferase